ncbi:hypothetical protein FI667_g5016, partial [Globisporangium splendens]
MAPTSHAGKDPLTWSYVKLFAHQITHELVEFDVISGSHSWKWRQDGIWRARLITKAQVIGVLVSIQERAERVEFFVDDGTALVKAVLWNASLWQKTVALGDLVHVEGKLNMDKSWHNDASAPMREIRVVRLSKVDDPNEELLHWVHVMELSREVYSASAATSTTFSSGQRVEGDSTMSTSHRYHHQETDTWDRIVLHAFFDLNVDADAKSRFLNRETRAVHDELLLTTLDAWLHEQRQVQQQTGIKAVHDGEVHAVRVVFTDILEQLTVREEARSGSHDSMTKHTLLRNLRKVFAILRNTGLLFLEDTETDRHVLLSFDFVLRPALLRVLQGNGRRREYPYQPNGLLVVELADWVFSQPKFQRLPLEWLELALQRLLRANQITQHEDSQRFQVVEETEPKT